MPFGLEMGGDGFYCVDTNALHDVPEIKILPKQKNRGNDGQVPSDR